MNTPNEASEPTARFAPVELRQFAHALLTGADMPADKADDVADILIEGDLLGHQTHGLESLPSYLQELADGGMTLHGKPDVIADQCAVLTWGGKRLPGPWLTLKAVAEASRRARRLD